MKFSELYPGVKYLTQKYFEGDEVVKGKFVRKCCMCDNLTVWYSISFLGFFCSEECLRKEWDNYNRDTLIELETEIKNAS